MASHTRSATQSGTRSFSAAHTRPYRGVKVLTGFRGEDVHRDEEESILDRFFWPGAEPSRARDPTREEHLSREELVEREHQARLREYEEWPKRLEGVAGKPKSAGGRLTLGYRPPRRTARPDVV